LSQLKKLSLNRIYQILLISLAFLTPLTVSGGNIIVVLIVILWLFSGDYKSKYKKILGSQLMKASLIFFFIHVLGLLWTEDLNSGLLMVKKMWYFLLLWPVLFTIVEKESVKYYIYAFLMAMALTELLSYGIWLEIIPPFKNAIVDDPTPFMSHISYNPILTIAIYLVAHELLFNKKISNYKWYSYAFFIATMSVNMFITGGRAGQVMYFSMIFILMFQLFSGKMLKPLFLSLIIVPLIFTSAYHSNGHFKNRVDLAVDNIVHYGDELRESKSINKQSSVGQRITYTINSWEIIKNNPFIGVGTGDFVNEYAKVNQKNSPEVANTTNPHNMYVLILVELGLLGLVSMLSIFYYQFKIAIRSTNQSARNLGIALPSLFLIIMFSDSYLLGHYTTLIFVFFSSFLYKKFE
jgi:O-antigen ligase